MEREGGTGVRLMGSAGCVAGKTGNRCIWLPVFFRCYIVMPGILIPFFFAVSIAMS